MPYAIMRSTRSLTSLSLSSSSSHQMTWVQRVAAFQPRPRNEKPGAVIPPGLGTLLKDISLYTSPVSRSRSRKLHYGDTWSAAGVWLGRSGAHADRCRLDSSAEPIGVQRQEFSSSAGHANSLAVGADGRPPAPECRHCRPYRSVQRESG